jgi:hypothetical protein
VAVPDFGTWLTSVCQILWLQHPSLIRDAGQMAPQQTGPHSNQLYLSIEGARNSDSGCTSCSHVTESIVLFFFPNWHRLLSYVPFFCSSCKFHPIISELQPSYFVALKDGGLCFLDAVFDFIEESV